MINKYFTHKLNNYFIENKTSTNQQKNAQAHVY